MAISEDETELWYRLEQLDGVDSILAYSAMLNSVQKGGVQTLRPEHLRPIAEALYKGETEGGVRACVSAPPRHGKTLLLQNFVIWYLQRHPTNTIAYIMHTQALANKKASEMRDLAKKAGLRLRNDSRAKSRWGLLEGGGFDAMGVGQSPIGMGFNWIIVDDPIRNREDAESATIRDKVFEAFKADILSRLEPKGNVLVTHQRWHEDDPIGRLVNGDGAEDGGHNWTNINLPAVSDEVAPDGSITKKALWGERWPLEALDIVQSEQGAYNWASQYLGQPRPKGGRLFGEPARYVAADLQGARIVMTADPAATDKTSADHSVILVMALKGIGAETKAYILDVWRGQVQVPHFVQQLITMQKKWQCPIHVEAVGGFKAIPQLIRQIDPTLKVAEIKMDRGDKFCRAQGVAAAWNTGRVLIPYATTPWVGDFLKEIQVFTGVSDKADDQVDALAHAWNTGYRKGNDIIRGPQIYRV